MTIQEITTRKEGQTFNRKSIATQYRLICDLKVIK